MPEPYEIASLNIPEDAEIHALLAACPDIEPVRFSNDEFIVHSSDDEQDIYIILKGNCLVEQPDAPRERTPGNELAVICAELEKPVFIGEMAYLGGGFRSASVRSVMACFTLRLKPAHLDTMMERFPGFTRLLCRQFAERLGEANTFIKRFQDETAMKVEQHFLNPGDVLMEVGKPADAMFQLVDGVLIETREGDEKRLHPVDGKPCFLASREFLMGAQYEHRVVAKSPAIVISLHKDRKAAVLRNFPELAIDILEVRTESPTDCE